MRHFQCYIRAELTRRDAAITEHPLFTPFIDRYAGELRDFVFGGVSLSRQFRVGEIERLTGDSTSLMRLDIWDSLKSHIEAAEQRFLEEAEDLAICARSWTGRATRHGNANDAAVEVLSRSAGRRATARGSPPDPRAAPGAPVPPAVP